MTQQFILRLLGILVAIAFIFGPIAAEGAVVPGHVETWGRNLFGEATPPPGLDGVIAVAGGSTHSLALRTNGTVVAWGSADNGQSTATVPVGLTNVVAIAANGFSGAVKADGTVVIWDSDRPELTNVPPEAVGITALALGGSAVLALRSDRSVVAWGYGSETNVPAGLTNVVGISALNGHALALTAEGRIVGWGGNDSYGHVSHPAGLTNVIQVGAGQSVSVALKADGTLFRWGSPFAEPGPPPAVSGIVDFDVGNQHALALREDGTVVAWGTDFAGQGSVPPLLNGVTALSAGGNHNLVVTARPIIQSITPLIRTTVGATVTLTVTATGGPIEYVWQHEGDNIPGGTNATLTIHDAQPDDGGNYGVYVSNPRGYNYTATTLLFELPIITAQPRDRTVYRGENGTFSVEATGLEPLAFQWFKDGALLANETNRTIVLPTLGREDSGTFQVRITDAAGGSVTSSDAMLRVIDPREHTLSLRPIIDTSIHSQGSNPQGVATILSGTRRNGIQDRGLLRFDLSSIPTNAILEAASLHLRLVKAPPTPLEPSFGLHRLLRSWGTEATWANAAAASAWSAPGGAAGVDYTSNQVAGEFVPASGDWVFGATNELFADLNAWVQDPAANHGWILISGRMDRSTARHFGSSESATSPELSIRYFIPADTPVLGNIRREGANVLFEIEANSGWIYNIESRELADRGLWTVFTNAPAGAALTPVVITIPLTESQRYFRAFRN